MTPDGYLNFHFITSHPSLMIWVWHGNTVEVPLIQLEYYTEWDEDRLRGWFGVFYIELLMIDRNKGTAIIRQTDYRNQD